MLEDETGKYSPDGWIGQAHARVREVEADAIVVEKTYGQDITMQVMENSSYSDARIIGVDYRRGKAAPG